MMFRKRMSSCYLATMVILNMMWNSGLAQPPSPPDSECTSSLLSLLNCEPVLAGGNVSTPPDSCCAGLNDLVRSAPTCLCGVMAANPNFSSINLTRALELPDKCGIPTDKGRCGALAAPPPSPQRHPSSDSPGFLAPTGSTGLKLVVSSLLWCWALLGSIIVLGPSSH